MKVKKSRRKETRKVGRGGLKRNCVGKDIGKGLDEDTGEFVEEGLK